MDTMLTQFDSRLFNALSKSSDRIFFYYGDMKRGIARWSQSAVEYFGLPGQVLNPSSIWDEKVHPDDREAYNESFAAMFKKTTPYHNCEYRITNAEGKYVWINCRGYMTYDENGDPDFFAGFVTNMGALTKIDTITGLWTDYGFRNDISSMLEQHLSGAALQLDIRNFKRINSHYGYDFGDIVFYTIGQIITGLTKNGKNVYRLSGSQFAILTDGGKAELEDFYSRLTDKLKDLSVNGVNLHIDVAAAATFIPKDGEFTDQIRSNLAYTLSNAKHMNYKSILYFSNEIFEQRNKIIKLTDALRESIIHEFNGFRIVLQPIIDAKTGKLYSAEALLRWSNRDFPKIGPMDFVPILEQTEDIIKVGKWVVDKALGCVYDWNKKNSHYKLDHININFSYVQFSDPTLKDYIVSELDKYGLPHDTLIAELTESCRVEYTDKLAEILQSFRDEGITIALDDFGTGYSSLAVLKDIPTDIVKLDHTMMRTISDCPKDRNLVEFIITYCNKINIDVCTEGIETNEALEIVKSADTKYIQGYYYDKPLETNEFFNKYIS